MKCALAIFAKTIGMTPVKTRLAADIGVRAAETFYRLSIDCVGACVREAVAFNPHIVPFWVLAEEEAVDLDQWRGFNSMWTGEGGLGSRLATVSEALFEDHDAVVFIGTDSPQLTSDIFQEAYDRISSTQHGCVAGPAEDGGFYLFGSAKPVQREIWESVHYSLNTTLAELQALLEDTGRPIDALTVEQDADVADDLARLEARLDQQRSKLLPAQLELLQWLQNR